jgi:myotubularin-related protein 6/7/8
MVGITQNARSIQDEKLIESIFMTHSQHSHSLQPMSVSDRPVSPSNSFDASSGGQVYGATATNIIIDARPTKNAYANSVKGAGTENMLYYKNCRKEYLGIDNIHVMRSSLSGIFDGAFSYYLPPLSIVN